MAINESGKKKIAADLSKKKHGGKIKKPPKPFTSVKDDLLDVPEGPEMGEEGDTNEAPDIPPAPYPEADPLSPPMGRDMRGPMPMGMDMGSEGGDKTTALLERVIALAEALAAQLPPRS